MAINFLKKLLKPKVTNTGIIFIVEDNAAYAKTLELFLKSNFSRIKEVRIFPVGETCLMEMNKNPDLIIIDYFLDSKYFDAKTGLDTIREIRAQNEQVNIIVLSSQSDLDVMLEAVKKHECSYVKKDDNAFGKIEEIVKEIGIF